MDLQLGEFRCDVIDAGQVWNQESGLSVYQPGDDLQFHLTNGTYHIWIMRVQWGPDAVLYKLAFGPCPGQTGPLLTLDDLQARLRDYCAQEGILVTNVMGMDQLLPHRGGFGLRAAGQDQESDIPMQWGSGGNHV